MRVYSRDLCLFVLLLFVLDTGIQAQEKLPPIYIHASEYKNSNHNPQAIQISSEDLKRNGISDLSQALSSIPSFHIVPFSGGSSTALSRGSDPNFTTLTLDGVPLNDPTDLRGGAFDLSEILVSSFESAEITPGLSSMRYGNVGIGGSINLSSRQINSSSASGERLQVSSKVGNYEYQEASGLMFSRIGDVGAKVGAGYANNGSLIPGYEHEKQNAHLRVEKSLHDEAYVAASVHVQHGTKLSFPDDSGGVELANIREQKRDEYQRVVSSVQFDQLEFGPVREFLTIGGLVSKNDSESPGVSPGLRDPFGIPKSSFETSFSRAYARSVSVYDATENLNFWLGLEGVFEEAEEAGNLTFFREELPTSYAKSRMQTASLLGAEYQVLEYMSLLGEYQVRTVSNEQFIPGYGLTARFDELPGEFLNEFETAVSIRRDSKQASFYALYNPIVGNMELEIEENTTIELMTKYKLSRDTNLGAKIFQTDFTNLIDFDGGPPPKLINRSSVRTQGAEFFIDSHFDMGVSVKNSLTFSYTEDRILQQQLIQRPKLLASNIIGYAFSDQLSLFSTNRFVGSRKDSSIATGSKYLSSYLNIDCGLSYAMHDNVSLSLEVQNLLDKKYYYTIGNPSAGITPFIGLNIGL